MSNDSNIQLAGFGRRISDARKAMTLSREALAKQVGTSGPVIGRYEREEMMPSVETAARIADSLGLSLDYLVGVSPAPLADKKLLERVDQIAALPEDEKSFLLRAMDGLLRDIQARRTYSAV